MPKKLENLSKRASNSIASQTQTYSKQSCRFVDGVYPQYAEYGNGPMLVDVQGNTFIDYICGLGTNVLGYGFERVSERVVNQIARGTLFSLPHRSEILLAEKIKDMIPSIELLRFLKSGSEAVSAGIKIARAYTGRDIVLSNGYHGWHDWSTPITENNLGTPKEYGQSIIPFKYGDLDNLKTLLCAHKVACVVLDPVIFDIPKDDYFDKLIKLAHKYGALVLFDEVVTGIRWSKYSVQRTYNVKPDLTALGKAMANGFPISCIGGKKNIMKVLDNGCFVSSTYGGDLVGISAALATLDVVTTDDVPSHLYESGSVLMEGLAEIGVYCDGTPYRQRMNFPSPEHKALFWQECVGLGLLFGGAQHTSYSHTMPIIERTIDMASEAMEKCKPYWDNPAKGLRGKLPKPVLAISKLRN